MCRVCLSTFIYGDKYQDYIPFLVYSCHASNPGYDILLFLHGKLRPDIRALVDWIGKKNISFVENAFVDCPRMNPLKSKCLRWVMYDERFLGYDYLYVVDIDMIYIKEPMPLHEQHRIHMEKTGLPYDNLARHFQRRPWRFVNIGYRIKHAGFTAFLPYLFGSRNDYRASGLHFIDVKPYYAVIDAEIREKYRKMIYNDSFLKYCLSSNDEAFLYSVLEREGLHPEKMPVQTESYIMLDFNNPERDQFRPHHGIHLGIFREDLQAEGRRKTILDSEPYAYYLDRFKADYLTDPLFKELLDHSSDGIKRQFDNLFRYYNI